MHMDKKSSIIIALVVIFAIIGIFVISLQSSTVNTDISPEEVASTTQWLNTPAEKTTTLEVTAKTVVTAKHAFRNGEHIVAGEIPLPTPCHILEASAVASSDKKFVSLTLASSVKTGEMCAQVITPARFKVSAKADKSATITAMLNGQPVVLNLIEAGPNEDLDAFELYIKG